MVHLDWFNLAFKISWSEYDIWSFLKNSSLHTPDSNCSMSLDFVNIINWNSQWFLDWSLWGLEQVNSLDQAWPIVPWHFLSFQDHVLSWPSWYWDELSFVWVVSNFFQVLVHLYFDLIESLFWVSNTICVHFVYTNNQLLDSQSVGKQ